MTEHPSLKFKKPDKLNDLQEKLTTSAEKPLTVIPIGIVDTTPIVERLEENTKRQVETLHETVAALLSLKETADSPMLEAKIDDLLAIFTEIRDNEKAFFVKVETELNR